MIEPDNHNKVQQCLEWWCHGEIKVGAMSELNALTQMKWMIESQDARVEMPPRPLTMTQQVMRRELLAPGLMFVVKFMAGAREAGI